MIYYYYIRLAFYKNDERILKDYYVSFAELIDFLIEKRNKNSSMEIYWIKPKFYY